MKRLKKRSKASYRTVRQSRNRNTEQTINEMLKLCLQKVCELQAEIERDDDDNNHIENGNDDNIDPETAGYTACAIETLRFLSNQGLSADDPIVKRLTERLLTKRN